MISRAALLASPLALLPILTGATASAAPTLSGRAHVQDLGWMPVVSGTLSDGVTIGTEGRSLRLEAFELDGWPLQYQANVDGLGWLKWVPSGTVMGTTGQSRRIEGVRIMLPPGVDGSVEYRTHVQNYGWGPWVRDGAGSGTKNMGLRIEALTVRVR